MTIRRVNTRATRERNARILAASRVCWLCGHDGADAVDHKESWKACVQRGADPDRLDNLAPAHHFVPCPTCGIKCNRVKSDKPIAPVMRRTPGVVRPGGEGGSPPPGRSGRFPA